MSSFDLAQDKLRPSRGEKSANGGTETQPHSPDNFFTVINHWLQLGSKCIAPLQNEIFWVVFFNP
jgi:hypothetical protein